MGRRRSVTGTIDDLRLALDDLQRAQDLGDLFDRLCVGAARVSGATTVGLAVERPAGPEVVASVGRKGAGPIQGALDARHAAGRTLSDPGTDDLAVVPVASDLGPAAVVALGAAKGTGDVLALFVAASASVLDLHLLRSRTAAAAHRVQPADRLAGLLSTLRAGDAVLCVALDGLDELRRRSGDVAVESARTACGVHLLNGTRPPGDAVVQVDGGSYAVVLRDLKAPVDAIVQRLLSAWASTLPSTSISIGAALHLGDVPPIDTMGEAQAAMASARDLGGGRAHVAATPARR